MPLKDADLRRTLDFALPAGIETARNSYALIYPHRNQGPMSSTGDGDHERKVSPESSERLKERLRELERKLEPQDEKREGMSDGEAEKRSSALGKAFKISTELVAGVFVGGFIGWALDNLLMPKLGVNSTPLFLIVFLLLGIAAGFLNVFRAAREMGEK